MEVQNYGGIIDTVVAAITAAGEHPTNVQRIVLTPAEMQEFQDSKAFTKTVTKYYGDSSTLIIDDIITGRDGRYISFYLGGILVTRHPGEPEFVTDLTYPAGSVPANIEPSFFMERYGKKWMLIGAGHQIDDFTISKNANVELGIAIRKEGDQTNYGAAGTYEIALKPSEKWTFALTIGSLNADLKNVCDMYTVELHIDTDPMGDASPLVLTLTYDEFHKAYSFASPSGQLAIKRSTMIADGSAFQTIQRYDMDFIRQHIRNAYVNEAGSPFGAYVITLKAIPKWKAGATVSTEVMADISEFTEQPA